MAVLHLMFNAQSHIPFQPAFADKPKLLDRGAWTQAAPIKEQKHFRRVSDSIGNNYSPSARHLTTAAIYDATRFSKGLD